MATKSITTKSITLTFQVPENLDTPSEVLLQMRSLLLDALCEKQTAHKENHLRMRPERLALCEALLTES